MKHSAEHGTPEKSELSSQVVSKPVINMDLGGNLLELENSRLKAIIVASAAVKEAAETENKAIIA